MKKPPQGKSGEKHHPQLIIFSSAWSFVHTQMTCCSPGSLGPSGTLPSPLLDCHLLQAAPSPTKGCTKGSAPSPLNH